MPHSGGFSGLRRFRAARVADVPVRRVRPEFFETLSRVAVAFAAKYQAATRSIRRSDGPMELLDALALAARSAWAETAEEEQQRAAKQWRAAAVQLAQRTQRAAEKQRAAKEQLEVKLQQEAEKRRKAEEQLEAERQLAEKLRVAEKLQVAETLQVAKKLQVAEKLPVAEQLRVSEEPRAAQDLRATVFEQVGSAARRVVAEGVATEGRCEIRRMIVACGDMATRHRRVPRRCHGAHRVPLSTARYVEGAAPGPTGPGPPRHRPSPGQLAHLARETA